MASCPESHHYDIFLIGKTGVGKSASGNTLLGEKAFISKKSVKAVTEKVQKESMTFRGVNLDVYDTPGLFNPKTKKERDISEVKNLLSKTTCPVILLVMKADGVSDEDKEVVDLIKDEIPERFLQNTWILFTRGDELVRENLSIEEFIENAPELKDIVQRFKNRYHVFNNVSESSEQVRMLIHKIKETAQVIFSGTDQTPPDDLTERTVLVGKTGSGKSATGNTILEENRFRNEEKEISKIKRDSRSIGGFLPRYILNTRTVTDSGKLKRVTFGERDESKPHKTILLVGETGAGKSTIINAMVNYMLGVSSEDRVWYEIIETKEKQTDSQTNAVTVYDVFIKHSPFSLTAIDTPGFGSTGGLQEDLHVAESLHELFRSNDGVCEIGAVCLVVKSTTDRLTERLLYVFDAVLSLFGKDMKKNFVVFFTHAGSKPTNAMKAIKESKIPCAQNDKGEPVYFMFNNGHCENFNDEDVLQNLPTSWNSLNQNMESFLTFLKGRETISLKITEAVLRNRKQLTASIFNLKYRINLTELKQKEFEQAKKALEEHVQKGGSDKVEYEVEEVYKEKVPLIYSLWNMFTTEATCCKICEENCHYPGCWWTSNLLKCSVMSKGRCRVCTNKCPTSDHIKENKIYEVKTRKVKRTNLELKTKYDTVSRLVNEISKMKNEKISQVEECYECVIKLEEIALKGDSVFTLQYLDFLIEKVKETGNTVRAKKLEEIKKRVDDKQLAQAKWYRAMLQSAQPWNLGFICRPVEVSHYEGSELP